MKYEICLDEAFSVGEAKTGTGFLCVVTTSMPIHVGEDISIDVRRTNLEMYKKLHDEEVCLRVTRIKHIAAQILDKDKGILRTILYTKKID